MDELLRRLASRESFPRLQAIVLTGHSAGGMFVIRYQMSNRVHESLKVPVSYVVANPSSYPYPDALRPTVTALPSSIASAAPGYQPEFPKIPPPPFGTYAGLRVARRLTIGHTGSAAGWAMQPRFRTNN
jgi:hypothetical protein